MSLLRKTAQLWAMLACVSFSAWAIGCGAPATDNAYTDGLTDGTVGADLGPNEAGSATGDGGGAGVEPPPMPTDDADSATETE